MSVFEIITKEEYESATLPVADEGEVITVSRDGSALPLTWCEFCKGNYNEYHFGDVDTCEEGGE